MRPPCLIKPSTIKSIVCLSVCVLSVVGLYVFICECARCMKPIFTNPRPEYGLTRGTCVVARSLEKVAVASLLWRRWCGLSAADFVFCFMLFFFEPVRPAASSRPPCLNYFSVIDSNEAKRPRPVLVSGKTNSSSRYPFFLILSVVPVCVIVVGEGYSRPTSTNPGPEGEGGYNRAKAWGKHCRKPSREGPR